MPRCAGTLQSAYGLGISTGAVTFNSLLQAEVSSQVRGRVFAGMDLPWQSGRLLSLAGSGLLTDTIGIRAVYYLGGALLLARAPGAGLVSAVPAQRRQRILASERYLPGLRGCAG